MDDARVEPLRSVVTKTVLLVPTVLEIQEEAVCAELKSSCSMRARWISVGGFVRVDRLSWQTSSVSMGRAGQSSVQCPFHPTSGTTIGACVSVHSADTIRLLTTVPPAFTGSFLVLQSSLLFMF